jgi:polyphosphate kinase 2 (PPK2 family)
MGKNSGKKNAKQSAVETPAVTGAPPLKLDKKEYERELFKLQVELVKMQGWVKETGARIVILFEGRDAAGKGGVIKRILERVSPRVFRLVAPPHPRTGKRRNSTGSATSSIFRRRAKS